MKLARNTIKAVAPNLMSNLKESASFCFYMTYGDVKQRWLGTISPEAYNRALSTVNKHCLKQTTAEHKAFDKLCQQDFACEENALKALNVFAKKIKTTSINNTEVEALPRYKGKGRPAKGQEPDFYVYCIKGNIASIIKERTRQLERKSLFGIFLEPKN